MMRVLIAASILLLALLFSGCYAVVHPNVGVGVDVGPAEIYIAP